MKPWLIALVLNSLLAGAAYAGPQHVGTLITGEPKAPRGPTLNLRLVEDAEADPSPIHHSGMIGEAEVGPNATLGFGVLKASPKKFGSGDWTTENPIPRSRKAAVSFRLRF